MKIILNIASSADGFIADKNGEVGWLPQPNEQEDFGFQKFLNSIDIILMGSTSFEQILEFGEWAWANKITYVFTQRNFEKNIPNVNFINQDIKSFINDLKLHYLTARVWLLGGAKLIHSFDILNLIDECFITVFPNLLSEGIKLNLSYEKFKLLNIEHNSFYNAQQKYYIKLI